MPRRVGYSLLVAFLAAAAAGWWWWWHDWPGPHPRAVEQLDQHMAAWNAWLDQRLPDTAPPVHSPEELSETLAQLTDPPPDFPGIHSIGVGEPDSIAGLTVREALSVVWERTVQGPPGTSFTRSWLSAPDERPDVAMLNMRHLRKRWWSPSILRRLFATPDTGLTQAADSILQQRIMRALPQASPPDSFVARGDSLMMFSSGRTAAVAEDVFWRIRMEAFVFDLALIAIVAGLLALASQVAAARYLARRRLRAGFCRGCGYDLRASPGRCPECGRPAAAASANP